MTVIWKPLATTGAGSRGVLLLFAATTFVACQSKPPETKPTTGSIAGKVTLADQPEAQDLSGTLVTLGNALMVTNSEGAFRFDEVAPGDARLRVTRDGYVAQVKVVTVNVGEIAPADVALAPPEVPDTAPIISSLSVEPQQLAPGGTASLLVVAADADGDALTFIFTADNGFTVEPGAEPGTATVTAPAELDARGMVTVVVDDGKGGSATGKLELSTSPNTLPTLTSITATPSAVAPGKSLELAAVAKDVETADLTYTWTAPAGWTVNGTGPTVSLQAPAQYGTSGVVTLEIADGNGGTVSGQVTVATIENARPVVTSVTATPAQVAPNGTVALDVSAYDSYDDALTYTWTAPAGWTLNGTGASVTLTAPAQYAQVGTVTVTIDDGNGGTVQAQVVVSTVQDHAPVLASLTAAPPTVQKGGIVQLAASAADPDGDALTYTWTAPPGWTLTPNGAQATLVAPNSPAQLGTVALTVDDGNGGTVTGSIVVSTAANNGPLISSVTATPPTLARGGATQLTVSAADPDGDPLTYAWTAPAGWTLNGTGASVTLTAPNTPGATGSVQVTVTDSTGAQASGSVVVSTHPNSAPVVSSITANPSAVLKGGNVSVTVSAADADGDALSYAWTAPAGWTLNGSSASVTLTAPGSPGATGTAQVTVTDGFGGSTTSSVVISTLPNAVPVVASFVASPNPVAKGGTLTLHVSASDADGDALTYAYSQPSGWTVSGNGDTATVVAPATPGVSATINVTVSDGFGGSVTSAVVVGTRPNTAPQIASVTASPNAVFRGSTLTATASASDTDGDNLTYTWSVSDPSWLLSGSGASITVTAPNTYSSTATLTVTVSDGFGGTVSGTTSVSTHANRPPVISTTAPSGLHLRETSQWTVSATDPDGDPITYALGANAPAAASIDPVSGVITWTPWHSDMSFAFDVIASDGELSAVQSMGGNVGGIQFQSTSSYLGYSYDQRIADLNADGYDDAVRLYYYGDLSRILTTGSATFGTEQTASPPNYSPASGWTFRRVQNCQRLAPGDVDNDGDVDVVVACGSVIDTSTCASYTYYDPYYGYYTYWSCNYVGKPTLVVYTNDGAGNLSYSTYSSSSSYSTDLGVSSLVLSDLDADGDLDAVFSANSTYLHTWKNTAGALTPDTLVNVGSNIGGTTVGDVDGDGHPDIVYSDNTNLAVTAIPVSSTGVPNNASATSTTAIASGSSCMEAPQLEDLDGDADLDVAVWNRCGIVGVYSGINGGAGALTFSRIYTSAGCSHGHHTMSLADLDLDGRKDFIVNDLCYPSWQYHVAFNDRSGGSDRTDVISTGSGSIDVYPGDFDGDGRTDLYRFDSSSVSVYW